MYSHIYIYIYVYTHAIIITMNLSLALSLSLYIYIHICIEREREKDKLTNQVKVMTPLDLEATKKLQAMSLSYMGFYMELYSEVLFAQRYDFGFECCFAPLTFGKHGTWRGGATVTSKIVPFSDSVLCGHKQSRNRHMLSCGCLFWPQLVDGLMIDVY